MPTKGEAVKALLSQLDTLNAMTQIFRFHLILTAIAIAFLLVFALRQSRAQPGDFRLTPMHGVSVECHPGPCIEPGQRITARDAWHMKRDLGEDMMIVDIRGRAEAYFTGIPYGIDAQVPFMEPTSDFRWNVSSQEPEMEFRVDFVSNMDEALRQRGLRHDAPVVLMCRSGERAEVAAVLLRESGYQRVLVVRDGFEGRVLRREDGSDVRAEGGWKNTGLPWSSRVYARWDLAPVATR